MKYLISICLLCSYFVNYSQGKVDLNTFSPPKGLDWRFYGIGAIERTKDVKELHLTYTDGGRTVSYYFNEQGNLVKMIGSYNNESRIYEYSAGKMIAIASKTNNGELKKPVIYNAQGHVYSYYNPSNVYGNSIIYYDYDAFGNIITMWSSGKENLKLTDLHQMKPINTYKYDDKQRLIEIQDSFSKEIYSYDLSYSDRLQITKESIYNGKSRKPLKTSYNEYGLDPTNNYAMDARGNWIARDTDRKKEVILRNVVYFDGTVSKYTPK